VCELLVQVDAWASSHIGKQGGQKKFSVPGFQFSVAVSADFGDDFVTQGFTPKGINSAGPKLLRCLHLIW
jgi:hypothetical protein